MWFPLLILVAAAILALLRLLDGALAWLQEMTQ
jgi:hypothetical protein